jgi:hypothetical protein
VSLAATDGGSGVSAISYTTDGTDPRTSPTRALYSAPFSVPATTSLRYSALDTVANAESPKSQTITITVASTIALVQQKTASGSAITLPVTLTAPSGANRALVATIGLAAASSASVSTVTDSTGTAWTKGPVGFLSGANNRVEIWYRLGAPSVTGVTVTLSAAKSAAVTVSEWSGVSTAVDGSVGSSGATSTSVTTSTLTTTNAHDLIIGATNYPAAATSTLTSAGYTSLADFSTTSSVHGRAAYRITSTAGATQAAWTLSTASGTHGTALLALKGA